MRKETSRGRYDRRNHAASTATPTQQRNAAAAQNAGTPRRRVDSKSVGDAQASRPPQNRRYSQSAGKGRKQHRCHHCQDTHGETQIPSAAKATRRTRA